MIKDSDIAVVAPRLANEMYNMVCHDEPRLSKFCDPLGMGQALLLLAMVPGGCWSDDGNVECAVSRWDEWYMNLAFSTNRGPKNGCRLRAASAVLAVQTGMAPK